MTFRAPLTIGYAAVQIALLRGMRVIATAGDTYAQRLRDLGAAVTPYGDGMAERVRAIGGGAVDLVLDTAPVGGALPDLIAIADGDALPEFARLAAECQFTVPIAQTFTLDR